MDKDECAPNFYELSERSPLPETVWERRSESGGIGMMSGGMSHSTDNVRIGMSGGGAHFGDGMMDGYVVGSRSGGGGGMLRMAHQQMIGGGGGQSAVAAMGGMGMMHHGMNPMMPPSRSAAAAVEASRSPTRARRPPGAPPRRRSSAEKRRRCRRPRISRSQIRGKGSRPRLRCPPSWPGPPGRH